ncbi:MAG: carboxypeptidase-like regulatory domain-containing protein [Cytophagales bacterium]|nr:carboxypeptidase-like regulatory domain-containing protein [Cytophagales bacterium]
MIVTGTIRTRETGTPIAGASISVNGFKFFNYSDNNGRYILELPKGEYKVTVRHISTKTDYSRIKVLGSGVFDIELDEGVTSLESLTILARPIDANIQQSITGLTTLSTTEMKALPMLLGEVDIVKGIQLMPGVTSIGEGATGFNVRGGRSDQNLILLNEAPLFNTSHALGFVSSFSQEVVDNFDLYKGTIPAQYGGRASSVVSINTLNPKPEPWEYEGGIGPLTSRFTAKGVVREEKSALLISGRYAYPNWILKKVSNPDVNTSRTSFNDTYISYDHKINDGNKFKTFLYQSHDSFNWSDKFKYSWSNFLLQTSWVGFTNRKASPTVNLTYGQFKTTLVDPIEPTASQLQNCMRYLQLKSTLNYILNDFFTLTGGVESMFYFPNQEVKKGYGSNANLAPRSVLKNSGLENSAFINNEFTYKKFAFTLGIRASHYLQVGPDSVYHYTDGQPRTLQSVIDTTYYEQLKPIQSYGGLEPRAGIRYSITKNQSIKIGYNRMRQYIHQISNTTTATPVDSWIASDQYIPPQLSDSYSVGYFVNLNDNVWETSLEVFGRRMKNIIEYIDFAQLNANPHLETELISSVGRSYGLELLLRKLKGRWTGWVSYSYSQSQIRTPATTGTFSINSGAWFPSNFNKPHVFNAVWTKKGYKNGAFSIIATYSSGRPITAIESSYIVNGSVIPVYSLRNQYKIPDYVRIDISLTIGNVFKKINDSLILSIYNLLGRDNAYSVFYSRPSANYYIPKPYKLSVLGSALPSITYNFKISDK